MSTGVPRCKYCQRFLQTLPFLPAFLLGEKRAAVQALAAFAQVRENGLGEQGHTFQNQMGWHQAELVSTVLDPLQTGPRNQRLKRRGIADRADAIVIAPKNQRRNRDQAHRSSKDRNTVHANSSDRPVQ
jgi:hypothetical protein